MSAGAPSNAPPRHCSDHAEAKLTDRYSVPPTYFSWLEMPEKVPLRLVPSDKTTAMMAAAMPAATRPYSIAVAPRSSTKNLHSSLPTSLILSVDPVVQRLFLRNALDHRPSG